MPRGSKNSSKDRRIKAELKRLNAIFAKLPKDVLSSLEGIIEEAANIRITMRDMRNELDESGWVDLFQQSIDVPAYERARPLANQYNSLNKNYQNLMKMLKDSLPKEESQDKEDGFDDL